MFTAGTLTFQEFMSREPVPLAVIQKAILEFLRGRDDAVIFGAQAVNAYVREPRMTQDIDLMSFRAAELAEDLRQYLSGTFHIAVRVPKLSKRHGYRLYQTSKGGSRHLVDLRPVEKLPPTRRIAKVLVVDPPELIALKVIAYHGRRGTPKSGTDWRDLAMLLLAFPELKLNPETVTERLKAASANKSVLNVWNELVKQKIKPSKSDDN